MSTDIPEPARPTHTDNPLEVARSIIERIVWCTVTTVSQEGEPRSRLMHPVWFWDRPVPQALVTARPTPIKVRHLAAHPRVACFYWDPAHDTVALDADATWLDPDEREAAWRRIAAVTPPVGFDPAMIWSSGPAAADCAFLRLDARRIIARPATGPALTWRHSGEPADR